MKAASIDTDTLILGSMNWTGAGADTNDENTIIVHGEHYVKEFNKNFENLWSSIPNEWLTSRPDPESNNSIGSCHDGADNDFDNLEDMSDPGCRKKPPLLPNLPSFKIVPQKDGYDLIKGNINFKGKKIYHAASGNYYKKTTIRPKYGERWFCSAADAKDAGWSSTKK